MSHFPTRSPACPPLRVLERLAAGHQGAEETAAQPHIAACSICRSQIEEVRANHSLVAEIKRQSGSCIAPDLVPVDLVPGYQILNEIYRGGQGVVYKAIQSETHRKVALKLLLRGRSAGPRQRIRFEQEIALAASLRHPNIVAVHDSVHPRDGWLGYAMEYVSGRPLDRWIERAGSKTAPTLDQRVRLFVKVCDAVQYAHRRGIIHRDLKPGNILVDADGEPHLCDFGVAKDAFGDGPKTATGEFVGTLAYASPEQVSGGADDIDTRSDVYSLGVVLYEAVTGQMPYAVDGSVSEAVRNITSAGPRPPSASGVRIGTDLQTIILKALAKEPERRYQSVQLLGDDLRRSLSGEAIDARRSSGWYVLRKTARRHWVPVTVVAGVLILVVVFAILARAQSARLRVEVSNGKIERGRARAELGNIPEAESLLWTELLNAPAGVEQWTPGNGRVPLSRAWWALWELYAAHPCEATVHTLGPVGQAGISFGRVGRDDSVLIADSAGTMGLFALPDLTLRAKAAVPIEPGLSGERPAFLASALTPAAEIVTVAADNMVRRWDATTLEPRGQPIALPPPAPGMQPVVSLGADGALLAVSDSSVIRLMDLGSGSILETIPYIRSSTARALLLSSDGKWLAYAESDGLTVRGVGAPGAERHVASDATALVRGMAFDMADRAKQPRLFFSSGGLVSVIYPASPSAVRRFAVVENVSQLTRIQLSANGRWLAAAGEDRRISIWDAHGPPDTRAVRYMAAHNAGVTGLSFTPDDRALLSGHDDGVVQRWDLSDLPPSQRRGAFMPFPGHDDSVFGVAIGEAAGKLRGYSGSYDSTVRAWYLENGQEAARSARLGGHVDSIALSADGGTVAAAIDLGDNAEVVLLDAATLLTRATIRNAHRVRCVDLTFSPDGATVATVGDDGFVRLWNTSSQEGTGEREAPPPRGGPSSLRSIRSVRFASDGRSLAWGGLLGAVDVADVTLKGPLLDLRGNRDTVRCIRFSPDGRRLAAAGNDSTIWVWDAATGRMIHEMKGHLGYTYALAFSADGRMLASGGADGTVRLWDASTGDNLAILRDKPAGTAHGLSIYAMQFTPNGDHLFVGGNEGYLGLWNLRRYDRHIAGNLGYWVDRLKESGWPSPIAGEARRWAEGHRSGGKDR